MALAEGVSDGVGVDDSGALPNGLSVVLAEAVAVGVGVGAGEGAVGGEAVVDGAPVSEVPVVVGGCAGPPRQPERAKTMPAAASPLSESRIK